MTQLPVYQSEHLKSYSTLKHGFFTRQGGVSIGPYNNLNMALSKTDTQENVLKNHNIVGDWFGIAAESILTAVQEHTANIHVITEPYSKFAPPHADALITSVPNLAIGILTADCVPVLVYAPQSQLIAAIHAGWKGAKAGIIANTLATLEKLGAKREEIITAVGPAIFQESYEVDHLFYQAFLNDNSSNLSFFNASQRKEHYLFDLRGYVMMKLKNEGIRHIDKIELDTYQNEQLFFSYRRTCHRQEAIFGNQISAIMLA
jgi:YfiH family protein